MKKRQTKGKGKEKMLEEKFEGYLIYWGGEIPNAFSAKDLAKIAYEKALECIGEDEVIVLTDEIPEIACMKPKDKKRAQLYSECATYWHNRTKEEIRKRAKKLFLGEEVEK